MGQLVNGKWTEDQPFAAGPHHNELGTDEFPFDPKEKGRYHLYVSHLCPFAHRAFLALHLKQLDSIIGVSVTNPINTENGWSFDTKGFSSEDHIGDKILHKKLLHEVYTAADPNYTGRVTVPLLIDTKPGSHSAGGSGEIRIVSNESAEIVDIFQKISSSGPDLSKHADEQKQVQELIQSFTGSLYGIGKVTNQSQYREAVDKFYSVIDKLDQHVANSKFLASNDEPTTVDVLSFPFFLRFEVAYSILFQVTKARLTDYPQFGKYFRGLYNYPHVKDSIFISHIQRGIFNETSINKFVAKKEEVIVPDAPELIWDKPSN